MDPPRFEEHFPYKSESYEIIGVCMEVHRELGHGFSEIVYKDAIELDLRTREIDYELEKEYRIYYRGTILPHKFYADFFVSPEIILEIKASENGLANEHIAQTINYLKASGSRIGLLVNFGRERLEYKRLIF